MFSIPSLLILSLALCTVLGSDVNKPNRVSRMEIPLPQRCRINLCFAIDGSAALKSWQFQLQINFVSRVVDAVETFNSVNVAGVQYGLDNLVISPLTNDKRAFNNVLKKATFSAVDTAFISGGLAYCQRQVRNGPKADNKIVLLGTGIADFGGEPVALANQFRADEGELFSIGIGDADVEALGKIATENNVFRLFNGKDVVPAVIAFLPALCDT